MLDRIKAQERELRLPASLNTSLQGTAQAFEASLQGLGILLLIAVLVVYLVLGILYESFIHPLIIMLTVPLAVLGALLGLWVTGGTLNLFSQIGIVMLVGGIVAAVILRRRRARG